MQFSTRAHAAAFLCIKTAHSAATAATIPKTVPMAPETSTKLSWSFSPLPVEFILYITSRVHGVLAAA
jgi:hypothetical protein